MPKIKRENEIQDSQMSETMLKNCKKEIAKFGFSTNEYTRFLISVKAMKDDLTVLYYKNKDLEKYREQFIKNNEYGIGDQFQLEKFKIKSSDSDGRQYETGIFCPRSFWDYVYEQKIS